MDWKPITELPEVKIPIIVQTNYGYMSGILTDNGMFKPYEPYGNNVYRAFKHPEKPVYGIRWRYKWHQDTVNWFLELRKNK